jgi:hypothetical protein
MSNCLLCTSCITLEGISAKFVIVVFIAFRHIYIVEIKTTYKLLNAGRFSMARSLIFVIRLLPKFLEKN